MQTLPFVTVLALAATPAGAQVELQKLLPPASPPPGIFGRGLALDGDRAVVGHPNLSLFEGKAERAVVYERGAAGSWAPVAGLTPSDRYRDGGFGDAVDLCGDVLVVGAPMHDHAGGNQGVGAVYVYERVGGQWVEVDELLASDGQAGDLFGEALALDGDRLAVAAFLADDLGNATGKVYVFDRVGGQWQETAILHGSGADPMDRFGFGVALDGDRILVGAQSGEGAVPDSGTVHVFDRTPSGWVETAVLWASDGTLDSAFGYRIALAGSRAVVGAMWSSAHGALSGAAYVFEESGGAWGEVARLDPTFAGPERLLGSDVALDGDRALVGAPSWSAQTGSAHLFERTSAGWVERAQTFAEDLRPGNLYGVEVELEGETALVSALWDDEVKPLAGAVHALSFPAFATAFGACVDPSPCGLVDPRGGCPASTGAGAALGVRGSNRVADDALVLRAWRLPPGEVGAFVLGTERWRRPFGDGWLVVDPRGPWVRLGLRHTGAGVIEEGPGWLAKSGAPVAPGTTWMFQLVYSDAGGPCGAGWNATNAVAVTFAP